MDRRLRRADGAQLLGLEEVCVLLGLSTHRAVGEIDSYEGRLLRDAPHRTRPAREHDRAEEECG